MSEDLSQRIERLTIMAQDRLFEPKGYLSTEPDIRDLRGRMGAYVRGELVSAPTVDDFAGWLEAAKRMVEDRRSRHEAILAAVDEFERALSEAGVLPPETARAA